MEITSYKSEHEAEVLAAIRKDSGWDVFTSDGSIENYRQSLQDSITYVCYEHDKFCGYIRALLDEGFSVYISELYVLPECRNRNIGRSLLERVKADFSGLTVYALSDEDAYYEKIGYKKIGSVFEL